MKTKILLGLIAVFLLGSVGCKKKEGNSQQSNQGGGSGSGSGSGGGGGGGGLPPTPSVSVPPDYDKEDYEALYKFLKIADAGETNEDEIKKVNKAFDIDKPDTWKWKSLGGFTYGFEFKAKDNKDQTVVDKTKQVHFINIENMGFTGDLDLSDCIGLVVTSNKVKTKFNGNKLTSILINADSKLGIELIKKEIDFFKNDKIGKTLDDGSKVTKLENLTSGEQYELQKTNGDIFDRKRDATDNKVVNGVKVIIVKKSAS